MMYAVIVIRTDKVTNEEYPSAVYVVNQSLRTEQGDALIKAERDMLGPDLANKYTFRVVEKVVRNQTGEGELYHPFA